MVRLSPKEFNGRGSASKEYCYFYYDPECYGWAYFTNEKDRDNYADQCILEYLTEDGWDSDSLEDGIAGKLTHVATKHAIIKRPPDEEIDEEGMDQNDVYWGADWSERCLYSLKPLGWVDEVS